MSRHIPATNSNPEDIQVLRRLIAQFAPQCSIDLSDRIAVRQFLDDDQMTSRIGRTDPQICDELRAMLILLYRLEASSSEDLGVEGLRRLWHQHGEILARFQEPGKLTAR